MGERQDTRAGERRLIGAGELRRLIDGPHDGLVAPTSGTVPVFLLGEPRRESFLDEVAGEATWDPARQWYAAPATKITRARRS